jgi:hypothetical protein
METARTGQPQPRRAVRHGGRHPAAAAQDHRERPQHQRWADQAVERREGSAPLPHPRLRCGVPHRADRAGPVWRHQHPRLGVPDGGQVSSRGNVVSIN